MVKMLSIPNALPAMEPSVCSTGECPLTWAEHPVGVKLFVGKLFWRNLEEVALGVLQVELRRDLITHTALMTGLSAVGLASVASALSQQVWGVWGTVMEGCHVCVLQSEVGAAIHLWSPPLLFAQAMHSPTCWWCPSPLWISA